MTESEGDRFTQALAAAAARLGITGDDAPITLARRFGISGFVARHWPEGEHLAKVRGEVQARRLSERVLMEKAGVISSVLTDGGIPHFFVKGVIVARWLYEPGDRHFVDLDLCVPRDAREAAVENLEAADYRILPPNGQSGPEELTPGIILIKKDAHSAMESVNVDIRWGIEPIDHLLPRPNHPFPDSLWDGVTRVNALPAPSPEHHAALILYHLVHHDLLHIRSLLDFVLLRQHLSPDAGGEIESMLDDIGILRAGRTVCAALQRDLGLDPLPNMGSAPSDWRGRRLGAHLELDRWLTWAGAATTQEHRAITRRRIARRMLLLDRLGSARHLLADAVWPPQAFLRWRWPQRSPIVARAKHLAAVARKTLTR